MLPPQTDPSAYCFLIAATFSPWDNPEPAWLVPGSLGARRLEATKTQEGLSCRLQPAAAAWGFLRTGGPCPARREERRGRQTGRAEGGLRGEKPLRLATSDLPLLPANPQAQQCEIRAGVNASLPAVFHIKPPSQPVIARSPHQDPVRCCGLTPAK